MCGFNDLNTSMLFVSAVLNMYVCMYVCMYMCVCVYIYIYIYICKIFFLKSLNNDYNSCDMKPSSLTFKILYSWFFAAVPEQMMVSFWVFALCNC